MQDEKLNPGGDLQDFGLLVLRLAAGALLAGHGAQKLFGWFGGPGLEGTTGWLRSMKLRPAEWWARAAGIAVFGGGTLLALGLLNPLGTVGILSAMTMATAKVHWGRPIWVTEGGAELPIVNATTALGIGLAGPDKYSLDRVLGIRNRLPVLAWATSTAAITTAYGIAASNKADALEQDSQGQRSEEVNQGGNS